MTTNKYLTTLRQFGLDDREQTVYIALLTTGVAAVQELAKRTGLERTGIYNILRRLADMGLVAEVRVGKKRKFSAEDPKRLLTLLDEKRESVKAVLPELQTLWSNNDSRPTVRYYEGAAGMRSVMETTLDSHDRQLRAILSVEDIVDTLGRTWFSQYTQRRIDGGLRLAVIRSEQKETDERPFRTSAKERRELRYAPSNLLFSMTTYIYDNKVAILSTRQENFGMIIESDEFATHQRNLFEALWQISQSVPES